MEKSQNIQDIFVQILKNTVPNNISLVHEMSDLLEISNDSAYRRIRGETEITLREAAILSNHFQIPLENLNNQLANVVTFRFSPLINNENKFNHYFKSLESDLESMIKFEKKEIIFAAEDIPVFHHFKYPLLSAFKLFYWQKSTIGIQNYQNIPFSTNLISSEIIDSCYKIYENYSQIPSTEIWTDETITSTLKQLKFYFDAGFFNDNELPFRIIEEFEKMIENIKRQAELGLKINNIGNTTSHKFKMYYSELMIGNNTVITHVGENILTYISYHFFNSMKTSNNQFNEQTIAWMNNLLTKSTLISGVSEKQRNQFFKNISKKIDEVKSYIQSNI